MKKQIARIKHFRKKYERQIPIASFLFGVAIDLTTLDRIDSTITLWTHCVFLIVATILMFWEGLRWIKNRSHREGSFLWVNHVSVLHFIFGNLLSAFSIFYAKSSSMWTSAAFVLLVSGLLIANEFRAFRKRGIVLRFGIYSLCLASYLNYVIPIFRGRIGLWPFLEALAISLLIVSILGMILIFIDGHFRKVAKIVIYPAMVVHGMLAALYVMEAIPPVPLSIKQIGIYNDIRKIDGKYELSYSREFWRFWESGAQTFMARKGDKLVVFVRIFSPPNFVDNISIHWAYYDPRRGWQNSDVVPMKAIGGRDLGFRGFSVKENFFSGDWRVSVETSDSREIGRIYFTVADDTNTADRTITVERY
jgi:hypothetical protein